MIDTTGKPGNQSNVMAEDEGMESEQEEQGQTPALPLDMFPDAKEGDTLQLTVVSVDSNSGVINVAKKEMPAKPGSEGMAEQFDQPKQQGGY